MKKGRETTREQDMLAEYDFTGGVRGKYAERYAAGSNVVVLSPDVAEIFPDSRSVNEALRVLADLVRRRAKSTAAGAPES
jgi:hypothetical protein